MNDVNQTSDGPPRSSRPSQAWIIDGYPIVDGKYHNLATDRIKTHTGPMSGGPPSLTIHWHNCAGVTQADQFFAMGCFSRLTVTEYISRVGEMLKEGKCKVSSLNATQYAAHIIVMTDLSRGVFIGLLQEHGLVGSG